MVFDCGTGARDLGFKLLGEPGRELELVFTHFHMDHVFGFPFFVPIYTPGYKLRVTCPAYSQAEARERLARFLNGVYHPSRLRDLPAEIEFAAIRPGRAFDRSGYSLQGVALNHPGGSVGYRVEVDGQTLSYVTDSAPFARPGEGLTAGLEAPPPERRMVEFLDGIHTVVYDTMYTLDEYLERMTWGHSYPEYAVSLCREAGVKRLVLFHHSPDATDDDLDQLAERWSKEAGPEVILAREGLTLDVSSGSQG